MKFRAATSKEAVPPIIKNHYLHRKPQVSFAFVAEIGNDIVGVVTFGVPPSRHMQKSVCPSNPSLCLELNRVWVQDGQPKNTVSRFVSWALSQLPARLIASYADLAQGHTGVIYRAMNFNYAGWTDMERKTPRFDYVVAGKHSREAFRCGEYTRVMRTPKVKYWIPTGSRKDKKRLTKLCGWPVLCYRTNPHPQCTRRIPRPRNEVTMKEK